MSNQDYGMFNDIVPAPDRNNNPGAIMSGGKIVTYDTMEQGQKAADANLAKYGKMTLRNAITKWSGGDQADAYVRNISNATGLDPETMLDFTDPTIRSKILPAMYAHENGARFPIPVQPSQQSQPTSQPQQSQQPQVGQVGQKETIPAWQSAIQGYGKGITSGADIYLQAGLNRLGNYLIGGDYANDTWAQNLADARAQVEEAQKQNPKSFGAGQVVGAGQLAYMTGGGGLGAQVAKNAVQGAVGGYTAEGGDITDLSGAAKGGAIGAGIGFLGGGINAGLNYVSKSGLIKELMNNGYTKQEALAAIAINVEKTQNQATTGDIVAIGGQALASMLRAAKPTIVGAMTGAGIGGGVNFVRGQPVGEGMATGAEIGGLIGGGGSIKELKGSALKEVATTAKNAAQYATTRNPNMISTPLNTTGQAIAGPVISETNKPKDYGMFNELVPKQEESTIQKTINKYPDYWQQQALVPFL